MPSKFLRIINVMAASLDGRIATYAHERDEARQDGGFTSPDDRAHLEALLSEADAVIVGSSSLKASGGALEVRNKSGSMPIWIVLTKTGLPSDSPFYSQTHIPRWIVSAAPLKDVPPDVHQIVYTTGDPAKKIADSLRDAGIQRALLFGGSEVNRLFYEADLVDELILTVCPILIAQSDSIPLVAPNLNTPKLFTLKASHVQGDLVFLSYNVRNS